MLLSRLSTNYCVPNCVHRCCRSIDLLLYRRSFRINVFARNKNNDNIEANDFKCSDKDNVTLTTEKIAQLSHLDRYGRAQMVDVGSKVLSIRQARASARVHVNSAVWFALKHNRLAKGNALSVAELAGIQAAKSTAQLIPLCHQVSLSHVSVDCFMQQAEQSSSQEGIHTILVECTAKTSAASTGVEMEALTGAAVAALTIYDMCKALDRSICIDKVQLEEKSGGSSGHYRRSSESNVQ